MVEQPWYRSNKTPVVRNKERRGTLSLGPEDCIQFDFFHWVDTYKAIFTDLALIFAVPNSAGLKSKTVRAVQFVTGLRPGVPDVFVPGAGEGSVGRRLFDLGLFIEFKSKTGTVSKEQKIWHEKLREAGYRVEVHRSWVTAANAVIDFLELPLEKIKE